ncbi:MAG: hypothetical protein M9944_08095 [Rhizobiaceae bacterium]|nr:hypothetical protein [Rhizobiaceae bacterium]
MANTIRLKRRAAGGSAGAPSSLKTTEPAFNEQDKILYLGFGDDGSANATSIIPIAGEGAVVMLTGAQTVAGVKTFESSPVVPAPTTDLQAATKKYVDDSVSSAGGGDMLKTTYDPNSVEADAFDVDNHVDGTTNKVFTATEKTKLSNIEAAADVTDATNVGAAIHGATAKTTPVNADELALIDSAASNVLKRITYQNLSTAIVALITDSAPGTLDTLNELAAALGDDPDFATTMANALALKAPLASPTLTGTPAAPTASAGTNTTQIATTANVVATIAAATIDGGTF